jgi:hypothetical protein
LQIKKYAVEDQLDAFVMTAAPPKNSGLTAFKQFGRLLRRS